MTFWNNKLFVTTLKSEKLFMISIEKEGEEWKTTDIKTLYEGKY
jgi:hypothetical protein